RGVTAAALGDIVEQRRQQQHFGLGQLGPYLASQRELPSRGGIGKARHVAQHAQGMFVDRVNVEQVVLHASEHLAERGQDRRKQPVPVHPPQRLHRRRTASQQAQERGQHLVIPRQRL